MSLITKDPIDTLKADQANISKSISRPRRRTAPTFGELADSYQKFEVTRLAHTTAYAVRHNLSRYILPRWSSQIVCTGCASFALLLSGCGSNIYSVMVSPEVSSGIDTTTNFGDSITCEIGASTPANGYAS